MNKDEISIEELRKRLLDEAYAGAFSGLGAMILDVLEIERASEDELIEIAKRYGITDD